jgi:hypothetical protein
MELKSNFSDKDHPQRQQTAREKLTRMGFKEDPWPPGEYSMILFENCVIHLIEDDAIPSEGLVKYESQQRGSFFLKRTQLQELVAKLRKKSTGI